jgi:ligand-binding sensor domain-containing protein
MKTQIITLLLTCFFSVTPSSAEGLTAKKFYAAIVDDDNTKWFLTEAGLASFDGKVWNLHDKNPNIPTNDLRAFSIESSPAGKSLWIATPTAVLKASLPLDAASPVTSYSSANSSISGENILSVAVGKGNLRWIGTEKGISAVYNDKWLTNSYERKYPADLFRDFRITSMVADNTGDTLFAGTDGVGIARLFRNDVDGISGASEYAIWGPIELPSDKIICLAIAPDGTQWLGTDMGVGRHTGYNTLEGWTIFMKDSGLADDYIQAIATDKNGNVWAGTKEGASFYDGEKWTSYTDKEGLPSKNILSIVVDKSGVAWFGTDNGVSSYSDGKFTSYK